MKSRDHLTPPPPVDVTPVTCVCALTILLSTTAMMRSPVTFAAPRLPPLNDAPGLPSFAALEALARRAYAIASPRPPRRRSVQNQTRRTCRGLTRSENSDRY